MNITQIRADFETATQYLLNQRNNSGFWTGKLSSSALSTAVAITAYKISKQGKFNEAILKGLDWLTINQNKDGGFGDTPESESNVSTSLLCYGAISVSGEYLSNKAEILNSIEQYLIGQGIALDSKSVVDAILEFYGKDFTFSVPILTMLIVCGVIKKSSFDRIPQLPFEFTVLPHRFYQFFNLQVVSYALPALVAVGIAIFKGKTKPNPLLKGIRSKAIKGSLRKLTSMMPQSGGYLEAIPLTAFVNLCLNHSNTHCPVVVENGLLFLSKQQREDGSWPIDTNISNWVTTLAIKSFGKNKLNHFFTKNEINDLRKHLLGLQYTEVHSFNHAMPGGWGWTTFSGSVPDADDTPGALLALMQMYNNTEIEKQAIIKGCNWLLNLQNRDGGIPTFSKGWGRLPFDSSCADLSGHALLAFSSCLSMLENDLKNENFKKKLNQGIKKLIVFLDKIQRDNGSWVPLWFGNQKSKLKQNPVYGTAKVCIYLSDLLTLKVLPSGLQDKVQNLVEKAQNYLSLQQNKDGSWGAESNVDGSIEETSLSISAIAGSKHNNLCYNGFSWLNTNIQQNGYKSSPIGLYFAMLWYDEELYPVVFHLEALRRFIELNEPQNH